ncbi:propionyl-CoA carboxylase alpha chain, mitochondrial-like isoform X2 [Hetaerina americana]
MGIKTVAVYSLPDYRAMHVKLADEAVCIGPASPRESYLNIESILKVVKDTRAEAIHPGYGFLSENGAFVTMLEEFGVTFIGPSAQAITFMGDKLQSKRLAKAAGVNTIPGFDGIIQDADHCVEVSRQVGYPVMIKASAGGGGKGMRIAQNDCDAREGYRISTEEATTSFGDGRMLVEKFIEKPRHIEIQVLADKHGNVIHLNERECSIQRRNQKIIEEAPSVFLDEKTRTSMGEQAVSLCKQICYSSAGTVEFLVDQNRNFYFLEMNTRLQVEHAITECITGVDLVHQMIRIAKGHPLQLKQENVSIHGCAIESRVYAEDPFRDFGHPSVGRLYQYMEPTHLNKVRCDSGMEEGSEISLYYDPMICKLVCYGSTRKEAIETSIKAMDLFVIRGVAHNIPLLRDVLTEENFLKGSISTDFLKVTYPEGYKGKQVSHCEKMKLSAIAASFFAHNDLRSRMFLNARVGQVKGEKPSSWSTVVKHCDLEVPVRVMKVDNAFEVEINGKIFTIRGDINLALPVLELVVNNEQCVVQLLSKDEVGKFSLIYQGTTFNVFVMTEVAARLSKFMLEKPKKDTSKIIASPLPGVIRAISCKVGETVVVGQKVCIVDAMKMQTALVAVAAGKVKSIHVKEGDVVNEKDILVELE